MQSSRQRREWQSTREERGGESAPRKTKETEKTKTKNKQKQKKEEKKRRKKSGLQSFVWLLCSAPVASPRHAEQSRFAVAGHRMALHHRVEREVRTAGTQGHTQWQQRSQSGRGAEPLCPRRVDDSDAERGSVVREGCRVERHVRADCAHHARRGSATDSRLAPLFVARLSDCAPAPAPALVPSASGRRCISITRARVSRD